MNWKRPAVPIAVPEIDDQKHTRSGCLHRCVLPFLLMLIACTCLAGCGAKPAGVSYESRFLLRSSDGKIVEHVGSDPVMASVGDINSNQKGDIVASVRVTEIHPDQAVFEVTYPDQTTERIEAKRGVSIVAFPDGKAMGVRLRVTETRPAR